MNQHHRRLQVLKERKIRQGIETPPSVITKIEDTKAKIAKLQTELESLGGRPLGQLSNIYVN